MRKTEAKSTKNKQKRWKFEIAFQRDLSHQTNAITAAMMIPMRPPTHAGIYRASWPPWRSSKGTPPAVSGPSCSITSAHQPFSLARARILDRGPSSGAMSMWAPGRPFSTGSSVAWTNFPSRYRGQPHFGQFIDAAGQCAAGRRFDTVVGSRPTR